MSRLRKLNDDITKVGTSKEADAFISCWDSEYEPGFLVGTNNCSLIAAVIVAYWTNKQTKVEALQVAKAGISFKGAFNVESYFKKESQVIAVNTSGHWLSIVRDGGDYALYQAWDGEYEVFPKLNDGESHNIFGSGADTIKMINDEVAYAGRKCQSSQGEWKGNYNAEKDKGQRGAHGKEGSRSDFHSKRDKGSFDVYVI